MTATRTIALVGAATAVGSVAGLLSPSFDMPASDAGAAAFARFYADERTALLVLCWSATVGMALIVPVLVALSGLTRRSWIFALTGLVAGTVTIVFTICGFAVMAALAYGDADGELARDGTHLAWMFINLAAGPPTAVSILAYTGALRDSEHGRPWLIPFGVVIATAHLVVAAAFARSGFLSAEGGVAYLVPCLYFTWIVAACWVLWTAQRRVPAATAPG